MTDDELFDAAVEGVIKAGGDPAITFPILSILADASTNGAKAKLDGNIPVAAIEYGRVAACLEILVALGQPVPVDSPRRALEDAEAAILYPEAFSARLEEVMAEVALEAADELTRMAEEDGAYSDGLNAFAGEDDDPAFD